MEDAIENILDAGGLTESDSTDRPVALTIAGSDSGGGAGIQADLKSFAACGVHGTSVVTVVTAQNSVDVGDIQALPPDHVRAQYGAVTEDFPVGAAKTGALGNADLVRTVVDVLADRPVEPLVVDPVMVSKHGDPLMPEPGRHAVRDQLVECATLVTPNRHEAEELTGERVRTPKSMKEAARRIHELGAPNVLIKGRHLEDIVRDYLYDGSGFIEYGADKIESDHLHGSGCVYSSIITARLAGGEALPEAVGVAREFITEAIAAAEPYGEGIGPVNPMHDIWD